MIELKLVVGTGVVLVLYIATMWRLAYENGKLKELVRQQEAELKQLKRAMKDRD